MNGANCSTTTTSPDDASPENDAIVQAGDGTPPNPPKAPNPGASAPAAKTQAGKRFESAIIRLQGAIELLAVAETGRPARLGKCAIQFLRSSLNEIAIELDDIFWVVEPVAANR